VTEPIDILPQAPAPAGGGCACGGHDDEVPVLDVRTIPHAIRHATVFGAFDAIAPGGSLVIVAPHAPMPLLSQLAQRAPLDWEFLVEGPEAWHVLLTRRAAEDA
jgi:uncharacterized protein (DUF2249 family)